MPRDWPDAALPSFSPDEWSRLRAEVSARSGRRLDQRRRRRHRLAQLVVAAVLVVVTSQASASGANGSQLPTAAAPTAADRPTVDDR